MSEGASLAVGIARALFGMPSESWCFGCGWERFLGVQVVAGAFGRFVTFG